MCLCCSKLRRYCCKSTSQHLPQPYQAAKTSSRPITFGTHPGPNTLLAIIWGRHNSHLQTKEETCHAEHAEVHFRAEGAGMRERGSAEPGEGPTEASMGRYPSVL